MRILTIGIYGGLPSGEPDSFANANVLQDYDAIVINPVSLEELFFPFSINYANSERLILRPETGNVLLRLSSKRRLEVYGLLKKGGVVVTFMRPGLRYLCEGEKYITNYDWLLSHKEIGTELGILSGTGRVVDNLYTDHPFYEYLKLKPSWTAYVNISNSGITDWQILASAYGTHALSLVRKVENGFIVLIPSSYSSENGDILESCIQNILTIYEPSPVPDWVTTIVVPGQEILQPKFLELNTSIDKLRIEKEHVYSDIQRLEKWKWLLYEKGKHYLEPVVRDSLSLLGFDDKSDTEQVADGFFNSEYGDAILEVEGSKESIKIEKISQLIRDRANYSADKKCTSPKGILVGNPFCEEPLENRPPEGTNKSLFTKELVETAEKQDIVVLLSTDLYEIVSLILEDKISVDQKQALRKRIFESTGLIRLA